MSLITDDSFRCVLQQLPGPLLLRGPRLGQPPAVAGMGPQPADVFRRHERPGHRPSLGHLRQPHRVQLAGLRPPGLRFNLGRLVEHAVKALLLQQEEHRLPVITGAFHPGPFHAPGPQPVRQLQQLPARGAELPGLLRPASPAGSARHPDGDHHRLLADVDPGGPLAEQRLILGLFHRLLLSSGYGKGDGRPREPRGTRKSDPRARSANAQPSRRLPAFRLMDGVAPATERRRQRAAAPPASSRRATPGEAGNPHQPAQPSQPSASNASQDTDPQRPQTFTPTRRPKGTRD